jgi:formylglycine-generating enzyme required for sulfatase activity
MSRGFWLRSLAMLLAGLLSLVAGIAVAAPVVTPEHRVALVIGNASYAHVPGLKNPANDAAAIAKALESLGFDVVPVTNGDRIAMVRALGEFAKKMKPDGVALFYYAGHGVQVKGSNYLVPVDADIKTEHDAAFLSINVADILRLMDDASSRLNLVILDACRDNPYQRSLRSTASGLAPVEAPRGTLVAYATAPGKTAADGEASNGLYTSELLKAMAIPGLKVEDVFKRAGAGVEVASNNRQTPWVHSSFRGEFYFVPPLMAAPGQPVAGPSLSAAAQELAAWNTVAATSNPAVIEAFLREFPDGRFARMARARWDELSRRPVQNPSTATSPIQELDATYVVLRTAKVRAEPAASSKELGTLPPDSVVWVTGRARGGDFLRIAHNNGFGYVSAPQLREVDSGEATAWSKLQSNRGADDVAAFLGRFPNGFYAERAGTLLASLRPGMSPTMNDAMPSSLRREAGTVFRDCADCPELVTLPGGNAMIGIEDAEDEREGVPSGFRGRSRPQHAVSVKSFALGKYEVTRAEFSQFVAETGYKPEAGCSVYDGSKWVKDPLRTWREPGFAQADRDPVVCASWDDAQAYVAWLSRKTNKRYRLPSEVEWEFAARAGMTASRYWGEESARACEFANVADKVAKDLFAGWSVHDCKDGKARTAAVGSFQPNAFGLHDMLGNVWEWTQDCWNANYSGAPSDGRAWEDYDCNRRVLRGGSWGDNPWSVRVGFRGRNMQSYRSDTAGFRVARGD